MLIVSFWMLWTCVGIWFRWGRCIGSWLTTDGACFLMRCSGICSVVGGVARLFVGRWWRLVMVLQALECVSDREAVQRLRCDIRWKAAAGLSLADGGGVPPDGADLMAGKAAGE